VKPARDVAATERDAVFDVRCTRADFPLLERKMRGKTLVYLDNANSTQKPRAVIDAQSRFYATQYANIHRGVYLLSQEATEAYDEVREKVRGFLNASSSREIIFVRGTTEGINLVARSYGRGRLGPGDEVLLSVMEHHSGIVPWQMVCAETGARLRVIPMNDAGELLLEEAERLLGPKTRILSLIHASNVLGTVNPVRRLVEMAHSHGIPVLLDGAQAIAHGPVDVEELACDFYAFSGHKLFGPTGIGVLYGRAELLEAMPPYQGGGDMIRSVTFVKTTYNDLPFKFEAGTPNIAGAVGLGAAIDYVASVGYDAIASHERQLLDRAEEALATIPEVKIVGTARDKIGVISFVVDGVHPHDVGTALDLEGIAVRAGHHCAQPLMERLGLPATVRASLAFYNSPEEVDALAAGLRRVVEVFR